ncbi:MAG: AAA family ATPase, partial [Rhizobiales bacterium]|nr:AAA family ATPase [Hyphomicrobiales bacterium]
MKLTRLKIHGFKSFVDAADIPIQPGVTGIVGPNGCGKSNLVEALRFVMGESSYKAMRGGGMDDVIFSGSGNRPARNIAEVTIVCERD